MQAKQEKKHYLDKKMPKRMNFSPFITILAKDYNEVHN